MSAKIRFWGSLMPERKGAGRPVDEPGNCDVGTPQQGLSGSWGMTGWAGVSRWEVAKDLEMDPSASQQTSLAPFWLSKAARRARQSSKRGEASLQRGGGCRKKCGYQAGASDLRPFCKELVPPSIPNTRKG